MLKSTCWHCCYFAIFDEKFLVKLITSLSKMILTHCVITFFHIFFWLTRTSLSSILPLHFTFDEFRDSMLHTNQSPRIKIGRKRTWSLVNFLRVMTPSCKHTAHIAAHWSFCLIQELFKNLIRWHFLSLFTFWNLLCYCFGFEHVLNWNWK